MQPTIADLKRVLDNITTTRHCKLASAVKQLAGGAGIPPVVVWEWLNGTTQPSIPHLKHIMNWAHDNHYDSNHLDLFGPE